MPPVSPSPWEDGRSWGQDGCRGPDYAGPREMLRPWSVAIVKWRGGPSRTLMNSFSITWTPSVSRKPRARSLWVAYNFALPCRSLEAHQGVGCAWEQSPWSLLILSIAQVFKIGSQTFWEFFFQVVLTYRFTFCISSFYLLTSFELVESFLKAFRMDGCMWPMKCILFV